MATHLISAVNARPKNERESIRPAAILAMASLLFPLLPACRAQDASILFSRIFRGSAIGGAGVSPAVSPGVGHAQIASGTLAPPKASPQVTDADSAAIKQTFTDFYESFSRHDAHATAMTFAEDADFTNMRGIHRHGRTEIEDWFANLFKGNLKSSNRTDIVRSIRFFTPQTATVDADTVITGTRTADGSEGPPRKGLMIATLTKQNGRWLISVFHEAEFPVPAVIAK
jgi:uncharacterized protein (TIGR02246 family)